MGDSENQKTASRSGLIDVKTRQTRPSLRTGNCMITRSSKRRDMARHPDTEISRKTKAPATPSTDASCAVSYGNYMSDTVKRLVL
ncbi:hypothetical protein MRB53_042026 [Persea americana]|nr:hypothetical protein MRB53_042026 [Persea americana]